LTCLIEFYCCFLHVNMRQFIDLHCVHTLFSCSLFRICLKQYNLGFCSSVGNIVSFQIICIIDLFDFYFCFTRWFIDLWSMCTIWFLTPSIENENSITVLASVVLLTRVQAFKWCDSCIHAHGRMTSLCLLCLERMQIYIIQQSASVMESSVHICREMILRDFLKKLCQIVKAVYLTTKRCVVRKRKKKTWGRRRCFGVIIVRPVCVLRAVSRPTTPSSAIKVKSISFI
jgi:hypothetical protein